MKSTQCVYLRLTITCLACHERTRALPSLIHAEMHLQSPRLPSSLAPSRPPDHGLASTPFDAGGAAPATPGTHLPPPGVAQHAGQALAGANLTTPAFHFQTAQPDERMVPVVQSGGAGRGRAMPLHVQLAGARGTVPSLQPRLSDDSAAETAGFVSNEPSLTPPPSGAEAVCPLPASPVATQDSTPGVNSARLAGNAEAWPDLGSQQLVRAAAIAIGLQGICLPPHESLSQPH